DHRRLDRLERGCFVHGPKGVGSLNQAAADDSGHGGGSFSGTYITEIGGSRRCTVTPLLRAPPATNTPRRRLQPRATAVGASYASPASSTTFRSRAASTARGCGGGGARSAPRPRSARW